MKKSDLETKKSIRRKVSAAMAVVVAATTVASVTYFHKSEVKAKDTLDSITQLMTQINKDQPYNILEIVPDNVAFSVSVNDSYGKPVTVSGNQTMGFMGYYISGQEPVRKDIERLFGEIRESRLVSSSSGMIVNEDVWLPSTISDSNIRYQLVDMMLDKLQSNGVLNNANIGRSPMTAPYDVYKNKVYYTAYEEVREGEADKGSNVIDQLAPDAGSWKLLNEHTYKTFIDTVSGNMTPSMSGNYIRKYESIVSDNSVSDDAVAFLKAYIGQGKDVSFEDNNFSYISLNTEESEDNNDGSADTDTAAENITPAERYADFEPNLVKPSGEEANVAAVFTHIPNAKFGYIIEPESVRNAVTAQDEMPAGTPLYLKDGSVYYYAGTYAEVFGKTDVQDENGNGNEVSGNEVSGNEAGGNEAGGNGTPGDNEDNGDGNGNGGESTLPGDEDNGLNTGEDEKILDGNAGIKIREEEHLNVKAASAPYILGTIIIDNPDNSDDIIISDDNNGNNGDEQLTDNSMDTDTYLADPDDGNGGNNGNGEGDTVPSATDQNVRGNDNNSDSDTDTGSGTDETQGTGAESEYYAARFMYTQDPTHTQYYGIISFFGADVENGSQYVLAPENSEYGVLVPTFVSEGWYGCIKESESCNKNHFVYDYESLNNGNYRFDPIKKRYGEELEQNTAKGVYRLRGAKIYCKLELNNDDWFKKYVFDRDSSDLEKYPVEVVTLSANKLGKSALDSRMIMLMSGDDKYCIGETYKDYSDENRIDPDMYKYLIKRAAVDKAAVVADYNIIYKADKLDEENNRTGNNKTKHYYDAYAMVEALMLEDIKSYHERIDVLDLSLESNRFLTSELADSDILTNNYCHFVNNNVYIYNMKTPNQKNGVRQNILNTFFFTMNDSGTSIKGFDNKEISGDSENAVSGGFEEVLQDIQNENLYRKTDKTSGTQRPLLDESITLATVLRYIAGYNQKRVENVKGTIRILEIEPLASFDLQVDDDGTSDVNTNWKNESRIASTTTYCNGTFVTNSGKLYCKKGNNRELIIDQKDARIELTRMSVAEFVGHIEDLNADYDMIYIGMNTGEGLSKGGYYLEKATDADVRAHRADKKNDMIPVYNDESMRGLVYTAAGDYRYCFGSMLGTQQVDYKNSNRNSQIRNKSDYNKNNSFGRTRYNGNDISEQDIAKIYNFIDAGYPVIFDDAFYVDSNAAKKVVNKARIDSTSYMYALASNEWVLEQPNVFTRKNLTGKMFNWYLNLAKPEITMYGLAAQSMTDLQFIDLSKIDNMYHASFEFELANRGAASSASTYNVALYIDVNADGKYSHSQEGIRLTSLVDSMGNEIYGTEDLDGKNVTYELTTGVRYTAQCQLARSFEGVVPWRLEVTQNDNKLRRTNATGYYKIKKETYTKINALQLMQSGNYSGWRGGSWNMDTTSKDPNNIFCQLLDKTVIGYDMNITAIKSNDFVRHPDAPNRTWQEYYDILTKYDMLILGFADCYEAPDTDEAMKAIRYYIQDGYSVLFSHDCSSYHSYPSGAKNTSNNSDWGTYWGYKFNTYVRNLVGMDRYNIIKRYGVDTALGLESVEDNADHRYDVLYKAGSGERKIDSIDQEKGKVITSVSGSPSQESYIPDHGYTYFNINKRSWNVDSQNNANGVDLYRVNLNGIQKNMQTSMADDDTYEVTKVNDGQLTKYPYVLPDRFTVANTHSQYFQLDFTADDDGDDESDIVVWYCMSDGNKTKHSSGDGYELSPNDVRNNYYIYNKGNITYTGVGHYHVIKDNGQPVGSVDEIKLFVNTLIACYQSGVHEPSLDVVESYENRDKKVSNIYLSYDQFLKDNETDSNGAIEKTVDIYFKTEKASLMQNSSQIEHTLSSALYYDISEDEYNSNNTDTDPDPSKDTDGYVKLDDGAGNTYYGRKITPTRFMYKGDMGEEIGDMSDLEDRVVYKATIPVDQSVLSEIWESSISATSKNNRRVLVVTTDSSRNVNSDRVKPKTKYSVAPVSLVRAQIFDLD